MNCVLAVAYPGSYNSLQRIAEGNVRDLMYCLLTAKKLQILLTIGNYTTD